MNKEIQGEITFIGFYQQPIVDLYEKMKSFPYSGESEIRVSVRENSYAVPICILFVLLLDSSLNRISYFKSKAGKKNNLNFLTTLCEHIEIQSIISEMYILRNILVHNHIWEIEYCYDEDYNEKNIKRELLEGYGDLNFNKNVDFSVYKTKQAQFNIIPSKIGMADVILLADSFKHVTSHLIDLHDLDMHGLLTHGVKFDSSIIPFFKFIERITIEKTLPSPPPHSPPENIDIPSSLPAPSPL